MGAIAPIPRWVKATVELQNNHLLNRGVLDLFGAAVPMIALTRNPIERNEVTLERSMVLFTAFVLAPLHAAFFVWAMSRRLPPGMMRLGFQELTTVPALVKGIARLKSETNKTARLLKNQVLPPLDEALRLKLLKAKTQMFIPDLIVESLVFANMGWIINGFTKKRTGKNQFSGEMKAVEQNALDTLYQQEQKQQGPFLWRKKMVTLGLPVVVPVLLGLLLQHSIKMGDKAKGALKGFQQMAHRFDYRHGIWMGIGTLVVVIAMQYLGSILTARSPRERKETIFRDGITNLIFFLGEPAAMWLAAKGLFPSLKLKPNPSIEKMAEGVALKSRNRALMLGSTAF